MSTEEKPSWWIYEGAETPHNNITNLPEPPSWRKRKDSDKEEKKNTFIPSLNEIQLVNTALYLRRPLLITGKPGTGKSSLAKSVAHELQLGKVLHWQITTQSTLEEGLYNYDAIGRLQDSSLNEKTSVNTLSEINNDVGNYIRLGALGTAFASDSMRVLLIDEIDKSDIDLPNNLLHVFEENEFLIPELSRLNSKKHEVNSFDSDKKILIENGKVECQVFPLIILTSNGEREFPPAFLRRCIQLEIEEPDEKKLIKIVESHLGLSVAEHQNIKKVIDTFIAEQKDNGKQLAVDQLLNALFLVLKELEFLDEENKDVLESIWHSLS